MKKRGPKPKPGELKDLEGNPGKRRRGQPAPKAPPDIGAPPRWLDPRARAEWERLAPQLRRLGLLTTVDRAAFEGYCKAYSRWRQAEAAIGRKGLIFETPNGYRQQIPEVAIAQKYLTLMHSFAAEFGFSPSSRTRLELPSAPAEPDADSDFFRDGNYPNAKGKTAQIGRA